MAEGEEQWITAVIDTVGSLIEKPKMSAKYLAKPPFKFLHETITNIIKKTGYASGLFTEEEMTPDVAGATKESKLDFLNKIMNEVSKTLGQQASIKPTKAIAGSDPEGTCTFLVELFKCSTGAVAAPVPKKEEKKEEKKDDAAAEAAAAAKKEEERQKRKEEERRARKEKEAAEAAELAAAAEKEREKEKRREEKKRERSADPVSAGPAGVGPASVPAGERVEMSAAQTASTRPMTSTAGRRPPRAVNKSEAQETAIEFDDSPVVTSGGPPPGRRIFKEHGSDSEDEAPLNVTGELNASGRQPRRMMPTGGDSSDEEQGGLASRLNANAAAQQRHLMAQMGEDGDDDQMDGFEVSGQAIRQQHPDAQRSGGITFKRKSTNRNATASLSGELKETISGLQVIVEGAIYVAKTMDSMDVIKASVKAEVSNWKKEAETQADMLRSAQASSTASLAKLDQNLSSLQDKIEVAQTRLKEARERVLKNEARISKLLMAVVAN